MKLLNIMAIFFLLNITKTQTMMIRFEESIHNDKNDQLYREIKDKICSNCQNTFCKRELMIPVTSYELDRSGLQAINIKCCPNGDAGTCDLELFVPIDFKEATYMLQKYLKMVTYFLEHNC